MRVASDHRLPRATRWRVGCTAACSDHSHGRPVRVAPARPASKPLAGMSGATARRQLAQPLVHHRHRPRAGRILKRQGRRRRGRACRPDDRPPLEIPGLPPVGREVDQLHVSCLPWRQQGCTTVATGHRRRGVLSRHEFHAERRRCVRQAFFRRSFTGPVTVGPGRPVCFLGQADASVRVDGRITGARVPRLDMAGQAPQKRRVPVGRHRNVVPVVALLQVEGHNNLCLGRYHV